MPPFDDIINCPDRFPRILLDWFDRNRRDLPWRRERSPYSVWISEIMLQQTVLTAVIPHYERWMEVYPDLSSLARSHDQEVMRLWEGLGYYSRARNVLKTARIIEYNLGGCFPQSYEDLKKLPGIGDYTASALMSLAFRQPYPVVDANVRRIFLRLAARDSAEEQWEKSLRDFLLGIIPHDRPGDFNEAVMELGQVCCTSGEPDCTPCPLRDLCRAFERDLQSEIPQRRKRKPLRKVSHPLVLLHRESLLLMKKDEGLFRDLWLLPLAPAEMTRIDEITSHISNSYCGTVLPLAELKVQKHHYTRYQETLIPLVFRTDKCLSLGDNVRWVPLKQLPGYPLPTAYRRIIEDLLTFLRESP